MIGGHKQQGADKTKELEPVNSLYIQGKLNGFGRTGTRSPKVEKSPKQTTEGGQANEIESKWIAVLLTCTLKSFPKVGG